MSVIVFCGPTIDAATVRSLLPAAECRPPAAQGDIHAASRSRPSAIALIDGVFVDRPSVWHREILAALEQGIAVWGAASMGALRAVECAVFGMVGIGKIVEAYRSGRYAPYETAFEDDDEVAVVHGPAELGSARLSEAMVDLRETLARAHAAGTIDLPTRDRLVHRLKQLFFPERSFARLVAFAREGLDEAGGRALAAGLERHRCSQKHDDAVALIKALAETTPLPVQTHWNLEETVEWVRFVSRSTPAGLSAGERAVLAALADAPARHRAIARRAAARLAGLELAVPNRELAEVLHDFRHERGLLSRGRLDEWAAANELSIARLEALLGEEAALSQLAGRFEPDTLAHAMLDELRLSGEFAELASRAARECSR